MVAWVLVLLVVSHQVASATTDIAHSSSAPSTQDVSKHPGVPTTSPGVETSPPASNVSTEEIASANHTTPSGSPLPPRTTESTAREGNISATTSLASSGEPLTSQGTASASHNSTTSEPDEDVPISQKPGLVAVICIFLVILLIGAVVILVKCYKGREPAFRKLDEVPMGKVTEGSPFAHYPPK